MTEYEDRYSRQLLFSKIGREGQKRLKESTVLVVGCGALGSVIVNNLTRAGVGKIRVVDRDFVELNNLHRQMLFDEEDVKKGIPKAVAAVEKLKKVNSSIQLEALVLDVTPRNVEGLVKKMDLVLDGLDNMETRYLLNDACIKAEIPWIYGGVIGSNGMTMNILPGRGPCLRCIMRDAPPPGTLPTCDTQGVINTIPNIIASLETTEAMKILMGSSCVNREMIFFDVWERGFNKLVIHRVADCPTCVKGEFPFLEAKEISWVTTLCGRNAVQITPPSEKGFSLERLKESLSRAYDVSYNGYLLRFKVDEFEFTIFPNGRVIIKGTSDESTAKGLYAKYIGT